jgi:hypothetical protein
MMRDIRDLYHEKEIDLEEYLRAYRDLANSQFMAMAHRRKIMTEIRIYSN